MGLTGLGTLHGSFHKRIGWRATESHYSAEGRLGSEPVSERNVAMREPEQPQRASRVGSPAQDYSGDAYVTCFAGLGPVWSQGQPLVKSVVL